MVRIEGLKLAPGQDEQLLRGKAARLLRVPEGTFCPFRCCAGPSTPGRSCTLSIRRR